MSNEDKLNPAITTTSPAVAVANLIDFDDLEFADDIGFADDFGFADDPSPAPSPKPDLTVGFASDPSLAPSPKPDVTVGFANDPSPVPSPEPDVTVGFANDPSPAPSPKPDVTVTAASLDLGDAEDKVQESTTETASASDEEQTEKEYLSQKDDDITDGQLPALDDTKKKDENKDGFDLPVMELPDTSHLNFDLSKHKRALGKKGSFASRKRPTRIAIRNKGDDDEDSIFKDSTEPRAPRARSLSPEVREDTTVSPSNTEQARPKNLMAGGMKIPGLLDGLRKSKSFKERGQKHGSELRPLSKVLETPPVESTAKPPSLIRPEAVLRPIPKTDKDTQNQSRIKNEKDAGPSVTLGKKTSSENSSSLPRPTYPLPARRQTTEKSTTSDKPTGLSKIPSIVPPKPTAAKRPPPVVAKKPTVALPTKPSTEESAQSMKTLLPSKRVLPPLQKMADKKSELKSPSKVERNSALPSRVSKLDQTDSSASVLDKNTKVLDDTSKISKPAVTAASLKSEENAKSQDIITTSKEKKESIESLLEQKEDAKSVALELDPQVSSSSSATRTVPSTFNDPFTVLEATDSSQPPKSVPTDIFADLGNFSSLSPKESDWNASSLNTDFTDLFSSGPITSQATSKVTEVSKPESKSTTDSLLINFDDDDNDILKPKDSNPLLKPTAPTLFSNEDTTSTTKTVTPKQEASILMPKQEVLRSPTVKPDTPISFPKEDVKTLPPKQETTISTPKQEKVTPVASEEKPKSSHLVRKSSISHVEAPSSSFTKDKNAETRDRRGSIKGSAYAPIGFRSPLSSSEGADSSSMFLTKDSKLDVGKVEDIEKSTLSRSDIPPINSPEDSEVKEDEEVTLRNKNKPSPVIKKSLDQRKVDAEDINKKISNLRKTDNKAQSLVTPPRTDKPASGDKADDSSDKKSPWGVQLRKVERKSPAAQSSNPEANKEETASKWKEEMAVKRRSLIIPAQEAEKPKVDDKPEWARASVARRKRLIDAGVINVDVNVDVK